jgi:predicted nucleic acid-binding protein
LRQSSKLKNIASSSKGSAGRRGRATLTGARFAILDTSIYIDNLRTGRFKQEILELPFVVRCSAVVLSELSRGARSRSMKNFVEELGKNFRLITPTEAEWGESGRIVSRIAAAKHYDAQKTREIHFDVLIAMGARQIGAVLITRNADDFKTILAFMNFNLVCW